MVALGATEFGTATDAVALEDPEGMSHWLNKISNTLSLTGENTALAWKCMKNYTHFLLLIFKLKLHIFSAFHNQVA